MINVIIDNKYNKIDIEGGETWDFNSMDGQAEKFLKSLLDRVYYGGETIGLFTRDKTGLYNEIDRYYHPTLILCRFCGNKSINESE